jgi:cytidine deaminase
MKEPATRRRRRPKRGTTEALERRPRATAKPTSLRRIADLLRRAPVPEAPGRCAFAAAAADSAARLAFGRTIASATPGLGVCAIRVALARARAQGLGPIAAVVARGGQRSSTPCGLCRQAILELAPEATLYVVEAAGVRPLAGGESLLPRPFRSFEPEGDR